VRVGRKSFSLSTHTETSTSGALGTVQTDDSSSQKTHLLLTKSEIVKMRARAIRRGIWFKVLTRAERAYIELTIKVVNGVRSHFLAKVLTSIIRRLLNALESKLALEVRKVGYPLALKLSRIAQNWGNMSAARWVKNRGFQHYLAVTYMNTPPAFKLYLGV